MEQRKLGNQGLEVSALGPDCMGMSDFYGNSDNNEFIPTLHLVHDPRKHFLTAFHLTFFLILGALNIQCSTNNSEGTPQTKQTNQYVGMWVTKDGYIRQELLSNERYDEARGNKKSAYQGRYKITGNHIDYWDDTGFTADGDFRDDVLYHGGYIFYRENK